MDFTRKTAEESDPDTQNISRPTTYPSVDLSATEESTKSLANFNKS